MIALIPARAGSKRVPGKNTRLLGGKPLIQWTIEAAQQSGIFSSIHVSTEDQDTGRLALHLGSNWIVRPDELASGTAPDIGWVRHALKCVPCDAFAILRPTSPFRTADTIRRAWENFGGDTAFACSSLRAIEPVTQHPGKMWQVRIGRMEPLLTDWPGAFGELAEHPCHVPWHSQPTQVLPRAYVQNASLEMAWTWCVRVFDSISGPKVAPFFTEGDEGFDINTEADWTRAEQILASRQVSA